MRIDIECSCILCNLQFTIHNIQKIVEGGGYSLSKTKCPNCGKYGDVFFDLVHVN